MKSWETGWEVGFPASNFDEMLIALVVRDLVHGASFDVEAVEDGTELALDFLAGDEIQDQTYQLLLTAEIAGTENREMVQAFAEQMLEDLVGEAETLVAQREKLGTRPRAELAFKSVPEDEERWDLVVPDWLAPDGAEVPFGFRSYDAKGGEFWPGNDLLDAHGRVVLVPFGDEITAYGIPAPAEWGEEEGEGLPVHPGEAAGVAPDPDPDPDPDG
jgi:hypothetical protein